MAEPHATAAGVIIGSGIGLAGSFMGAQIDALVVGLMAAVFISIWLPTIDSKAKAAASVALSSLFAGYGAPVAVAVLVAKYPEFPLNESARLLLALLIGTVTPVSVPLGLGRLQTYIKGAKA